KRVVESLIKAGAFDTLPGNRAQKLAVYEQAMDGAAKRRRSTVEGQISLFDALMGDSAAALEIPPTPLPDIPELPPRQLLALEKEMTGVYITGHPLDEYREELSALEINTRFLDTLAEEREDKGLSLDGMRATMGGIVVDKKVKATRKGDMMAFVTLEDFYGTTEALIFPKVYDRYRQLLEPDSLVLLHGRLSIREDDDPRIIPETVTPLKHGETAAAGTTPEPPPPPPPQARLYLKAADEAARDQALGILQRTPGPISVTFVMADTGKAFRAPERYWVNDRVDMAALKALLGDGCVVMK
ncbi:MAG: DNA polymerase III subunit alpha, partial [Clostridia bacterium]|nr:DNA polymerase III subunit alpha [Clostridia bacterium]